MLPDDYENNLFKLEDHGIYALYNYPDWEHNLNMIRFEMSQANYYAELMAQSELGIHLGS